MNTLSAQATSLVAPKPPRFKPTFGPCLLANHPVNEYHGSWLNIAENELSSMTRQCVRERRFGDLGTLHDEVSAWSTDVNGTQRGVDWQMKVDDARCKLKSVYPKIMT